MSIIKSMASGALALLLAASIAPAAQAAGDDLLQTIKSRGVMRVCDVGYEPWNRKNPATNQWEGINVDILDKAAAILKVKIEHVDATWATIIPSINTGKCDFAGAGLYISPQRAELVTFTRPFATDGITLFVPDNSPAKSVKDLDQPGKTIVVRSGSFEEGVAKALFKKATVKTLTADQSGIMPLEIAAGRADGGAGGYYGNLAFLKANPNVKVRLLNGQLLTKTSIAYAVPARQYFFRDWLNAVLRSFEENGELKKITDKWTK